MRFGLLTAPGLARLAQRELSARIATAKVIETQWMRSHDLVIVDVPAGEERGLFKLRCVEDIFLLLAENIAVAKKPDLRKLTPRGFREKLLQGLSLLPSRKKKPTTNFFVFVKQDADQEIYRHEIDTAISAYILSNFSKWKNREPADVELWSFFVKGAVTTGLRLTAKSFRQRRYREDERPGSLRPTIAAALALASDPVPEDFVIDPMCGSGTVLIERALLAPAQTILGMDIDGEAITLAAKGVENSKVQIGFLEMDTTKSENLKGYRGMVTTIVSNLPFGKQFSGEDDIRDLYARALTAWRPLLTPRGKMVLLTSADTEIKAAAYKAKLRIRRIEKISIKGVVAGIYRLERI